TIWFKQARFACVREIRGEHFVADALAQLRILNGEKNFDTGVKITLHPVRAAEVEVGVAAVLEIEDAAVLEEAAHHAADPDAAADAAETGNERTLAANDEVNFDACLRRAIERLNHWRVKQRVELGDDPRGLAALGMTGFAIDERDGCFRQ